MSKPIKVALAGAGAFGIKHLDGIRNIEGVEVVSLVSRELEKTREVAANGLLATVLQHDIDHTNGVLFIDYIAKLKRDRVIKKFTKAAKRTND